jgi:hypothetical protein
MLCSTQDEPAFCGLASIAMVLNALSIDPKRPWKGSWRWFHEELLDCCLPLSKVAQEGVVLTQVRAVQVIECSYALGVTQGKGRLLWESCCEVLVWCGCGGRSCRSWWKHDVLLWLVAAEGLREVVPCNSCLIAACL